jgi:hypothetical protein
LLSTVLKILASSSALARPYFSCVCIFQILQTTANQTIIIETMKTTPLNEQSQQLLSLKMSCNNNNKKLVRWRSYCWRCHLEGRIFCSRLRQNRLSIAPSRYPLNAVIDYSSAIQSFFAVLLFVSKQVVLESHVKKQ